MGGGGGGAEITKFGLTNPFVVTRERESARSFYVKQGSYPARIKY